MTYEQYSPEWLIAHCDVESAFERAVSRQMSRLLAENEALQFKLQVATHSALDHKERADALLEALQNIAGYLDDTAACNSDKAMASTARAAIAKAGGAA